MRVKIAGSEMHTIVKALVVITICGATLLVSCVPVPVPADLESVNLTPGDVEAIDFHRNTVVLAVDELKPPPEQLECVQSSIMEAESTFPLLESGRFLDAVFPWFEPSVIPKNHEALAKTLTR